MHVLCRSNRRSALYGLLTMLTLTIYRDAAEASPADVIDASARCHSGTCSFLVTVRHDDAGWDHYVSQWQVLTEQGEILGTRVLLHPHDQEQPFTRGLADVSIPPGVRQVRIKAQDSLQDDSGRERAITLP